MYKIRAVHFDEIASTQTYAREEAINANIGELTIYTASNQNSGIGRGSNVWRQLPGEHLYLTYSICRDIVSCSNISCFALVVALGLTQMLKEFGINAKIKWINDVLFSGKKLAGILVEHHLFESQRKSVFLVGIGLNVNSALDQQLPDNITSMSVIAQKQFDISQILSRLTPKITFGLEAFLQQGFVNFQREINPHLEKYEHFKYITLKSLNGECNKGKIVEVGSAGELVFLQGGRYCSYLDGSIILPS